MERGAYESNCQMEFTLPSARISEVTNVPTTDLVLKKVNKSQDALSGARFTLVNSETNESQTATSVDETGLVNFTRLRPGTYTLTYKAQYSNQAYTARTATLKVVVEAVAQQPTTKPVTTQPTTKVPETTTKVPETTTKAPETTTVLETTTSK